MTSVDPLSHFHFLCPFFNAASICASVLLPICCKLSSFFSSLLHRKVFTCFVWWRDYLCLYPAEQVGEATRHLLGNEVQGSVYCRRTCRDLKIVTGLYMRILQVRVMPFSFRTNARSVLCKSLSCCPNGPEVDTKPTFFLWCLVQDAWLGSDTFPVPTGGVFVCLSALIESNVLILLFCV